MYEDDFTNGFDDKVWTKEAEVGGFGNRQFEQTTSTDENVFVKDGILTIKPTLQDAHLIETNNIINLTASGLCTSDVWSSCVVSTNTTNGTIVNPVKSARISTKKGATIQFGRIEVVAKMPAGDWLWPAIWMLPVNETYGAWPGSGEVCDECCLGFLDANLRRSILQSREEIIGHTVWAATTSSVPRCTGVLSPASMLGGEPTIVNTLCIPPTPTAFVSAFHPSSELQLTVADTYGLEWTPTHIYTYIDTRLMQVLYTNFKTPFWRRGKFPVSDTNGTAFVDPWSQTGNPATPFDKPFYLILNVAVGGTNSWFEDGKAGKPWVDASPTAKKDFWDAKDQWYPTWQEGGEMQVKSVRMWQRQGYGSCK